MMLRRRWNSQLAVDLIAKILLTYIVSDYLSSSYASDLVIPLHGKNVSTKTLLQSLNITGKFDYGNLCPQDEDLCQSRCQQGIVDSSERHVLRPCYCDTQCLNLGDCCYDVLKSCSYHWNGFSNQGGQWKCVNLKGYGAHGYIMKSRCSTEAQADSRSKEMCETVNGTDLLTSLPVVDEGNGVVYRNVFCAQCHEAKIFSYWGMRADCGNIPESALPRDRTQLMSFIKNNCKIIYEPTSKQQMYLKYCVSVEKSCSSLERVIEEPLIAELCSFYSFPTCGDLNAKNPHCILCNGGDITQYRCGCLPRTTPDPSTAVSTIYDLTTPPSTTPSPLPMTSLWPTTSFPTTKWLTIATSGKPLPPPLNILIDFSSDSNKISVGDQTTVVHHSTCEEGFVYDPFIDSCRQAFRKVVHQTNTSRNSSNPTNATAAVNCTLVRLNVSKTVMFPNGSLWVPLYEEWYNRSTYFLNNSYVFVCISFMANYTRTKHIWKYNVSPLQIITYVGCSISVLSLASLFLIYFILKDLRTLPGKNLMNLSASMILYHTCLFAAGIKSITGICLTIAALLHYFLLTSFTWMSVMAFDVNKTFVVRGKVIRPSQNTSNKKTLIRYCLFGWGVPACVVLVCVGLDGTGVIEIGYGTGGFCWIGNGRMLLFVVGVPIATILLFNLIALTGAIIAIYKIKKETHRVGDQRSHTSLTLLSLKLTSVLGLTWMLGFISSMVNLEVTVYLFVTVNSLQGFFISVAFIGNRRTLNLLKNSRKKCQRTNPSTETGNTTRL